MHTKPYKDLDTALHIYYRYSELETAQICELFDVSRSTAKRYKNMALEKQCENKNKTMSPTAVNTEDAYEAWGIDVNDIEKRRRKLNELGFTA